MAEIGLPRLSLNQRAQHGVLAAGVIVALATGLAGSATGGPRAWHLAAGLAALAALAYHVIYLVVRGYVEGRGWGSFPLRWSAGDAAAAAAELRHLAGSGARPRGEEFRVSQKALYWWTGIAVATLVTTGVGLAFWEGAGTLAVLGGLATVHRGVALLLLASALWHLYGVLTWEGRFAPEWSWLGGALEEQKARAKLPGALERHRAGVAGDAGTAGAGEEERARERQRLQRDEVEAELEKGNRLALGERYVEALYHYRRALELYPGYSQARYNMARVLARMGEREAAVEAYRLFLEADPFHPLARKAQEAIEELAREARP